MGLVAWCRGRDDSEATESSPLPVTEPAATATLSGRGDDRYTDGPALKADESSPLYTLAVGDAAWWRACARERAVAGSMRPSERAGDTGALYLIGPAAARGGGATTAEATG